MKPRHASKALAAAIVLAASAFVALATFGCAHPQKRNDWRSPSPSMTNGAPGDGGAPDPGAPPGPSPTPSVQPSPNDIQI